MTHLLYPSTSFQLSSGEQLLLTLPVSGMDHFLQYVSAFAPHSSLPRSALEVQGKEWSWRNPQRVDKNQRLNASTSLPSMGQSDVFRMALQKVLGKIEPQSLTAVGSLINTTLYFFFLSTLSFFLFLISLHRIV